MVVPWQESRRSKASPRRQAPGSKAHRMGLNGGAPITSACMWSIARGRCRGSANRLRLDMRLVRLVDRIHRLRLLRVVATLPKGLKVGLLATVILSGTQLE